MQLIEFFNHYPALLKTHKILFPVCLPLTSRAVSRKSNNG